MIVHHRVPEKSRVPERRPRVPPEPQQQHERHPCRGQPAAKRSRLSTEGERGQDGDQRHHHAERILGEPGHAERSTAGDRPARRSRLAPFAEREEKPGQAELYGGREKRLGAHVAGEDQEKCAGRQGGARERAARGIQDPRPEQRSGRHGEGRPEDRGETGGPLRDSQHAEIEGDQPVEKRRLVEIPDAVQPEIEQIARHPCLARDLRVLPLARIVEGHPTEPRQDEEEDEESREGRGSPRRPGARHATEAGGCDVSRPSLRYSTRSVPACPSVR